MSLFRSGDNLLNKTTEFFANSNRVTLFSPFIKVNKLKEVLGNTYCDKIVVRWQLVDILNEVTDFEALYDFCKKNKIDLYRNRNVHLKLFKNEKNFAIVGSANLTNKGFGVSDYNLEASTEIKTLSFEDLTYLQRIIEDSDLVDETYYDELKDRVNELKKTHLKPKKIYDESITSYKKEFLISSLPMSRTPDKLWVIYSSSEKNFKELEIDCAIHDLALYNISPRLKKNEFFNSLKTNFNSYPFIESIKNSIANDQRKSKGYGQVVSWIQNNTTTVPTPRSWELKQEEVVNILYEWICFFDNRFYWSVPGKKSQVIFFNSN